MTNVPQIAEQILQAVNGANRSIGQKIVGAEVQLWIFQKWAELARQNYVENEKLDYVSYLDGQFISDWKYQPVLYDSDLDKYYSVLPDTPISLPRTSGVLQITGMQGQKNPFLPMDATSQGMFSCLEAFKLKNETYYDVQGSTVFYENIKDVSFIYMKLASVSGDAQLPKNYENQIINEGVQYYLREKMIPQDKTNDGNDKPDTVNAGQ